MRKKIKLRIKDERDSYGNLHQKKPYYLFIEIGKESFAFSNKKKAQIWLKKFEKEVNELFSEMVNHTATLYQLNIHLIEFIRFSELNSKRENLHFYLNRYYDLLNSSDYREYSIGSEINKFYYEIENQYSFYKNTLRTNNRLNYLYQKTRQDHKSLKRLKNDFDLLLKDIDGIVRVEKGSLSPTEILLRIA
jgi:hypothetical protein